MPNTNRPTIALGDARLTLSGKSEPVDGEPTRLAFSVPAGFRLPAAAAAGAASRTENGGDGALAVVLESPRTRTATWQLQVARER